MEESEIIVISTGESKIREIAEKISRLNDIRGKFFFHTSSFLSSDELDSITSNGGMTAAFSPVQTFAGFEEEREIFKDIFFLAEGSPPAINLAELITRKLDAQLLIVNKEQKKFLHIASVIASNFIIALLKFSESQLKNAGSDFDLNILFPLLKKTINNITVKGIEKGRSGPSARGEAEIVDEHLKMLKGDDKLLYSLLTGILEGKNYSISPE